MAFAPFSLRAERIMATQSPGQKSSILYRGAVLRLLKDGRAVTLSGLPRANWTSSLSNVQRLFSMFPTGTAGIGLLVFRVCAATTLVVDGAARPGIATSGWMPLCFVVPALFLCMGFLTPYCSTFSCLVQLAALLITGGQNSFHIVVSLINSGAVAMLGPGAYSLDAHIFGRRLLNVPTRR